MVVLKGQSFVVLSKLSLLGASVLGYNLGSLRHGMLGQFSREEQTDSSLDLSGGDGAVMVVVRGMHDSWGGMCGRGVCVAGACMAGGVWGRQGVHGRGHAWHGWSPSQQIRDTMIRSTRMHSSRMRTSRSLTVFRSLQPGGCTWSGGVYLVRGVPGPGGRGVYLVLGGVPGPGGCTWSRGVYLVPGGVPGPGGCTWSGGCTWFQGGVYLARYSPPVNRMTNRCKNITLAKTSFRPGNERAVCILLECILVANCLAKTAWKWIGACL